MTSHYLLHILIFYNGYVHISKKKTSGKKRKVILLRRRYKSCEVQVSGKYPVSFEKVLPLTYPSELEPMLSFEISNICTY